MQPLSPLTSPSFLCFCLSPPSLCSTEDDQKGERRHFSDPLLVFLSHSSFFLRQRIQLTPFLLPFLSLPWINFPSFFSPLFHVSLSCSLWHVNSPFLLHCPLRCFPNSWSLSGAAWLGPSLSLLHSHQERHSTSELCLLLTTTTRGVITKCCWNHWLVTDC